MPMEGMAKGFCFSKEHDGILFGICYHYTSRP